MATLSGIKGIFEAAKASGNDVMTLEVLPDGGIALTFREGLKEAYNQGDPIFVNDRSPNIEGNNNAQILDNAKNLEQILNIDDDKTGVGFDSSDARKLNQILNEPTDSQKIEIGAATAVKSTVTDTADIDVKVHLEHQDKARIAGGVETKFTTEALADVFRQLETSYQQPQTTALDIPIQAQDLQMLHPANIQTVSKTEIKPSEVTEFITQDSVVTLTNDNPPIMKIQFDEHSVSLEKLETQLNVLAKDGAFGANGSELAILAIEEIRKQHPKLVEQTNQVLVIDETEITNNQPPASQIDKPTNYQGITVVSPQAQIVNSL